MICTKCKKNFGEPLELYDGTVACPCCGKTLADVTDFIITVESEERFRLSETYFFRSLELSNKNISGKVDAADRDKLQAEWAECIDNAVKHCRIAAAAGHPMAIWRMGFYYDKDYTAVSSSEAQRCRIAYNFYSLLCTSSVSDVKAEKTELAMDQAAFRKLKVRAANDLLVMLLNAPEALLHTHKFNYTHNRDRLVRMYGDSIRVGGVDKKAESADFVNTQALKTLMACFDKTRVPLFGYFYISRDGLQRLIDEDAARDRDKLRETIFPVLGKHVYMVYFPCTQGKHVGDDYMEIYGTAKPLAGFLDNDKGGYICFINVNAQYMPDRRLPKEVDRRMSNDGYDLFRNMINAQAADGSAYVSNGLTFYSDDVLRFARIRKRGYSDALVQLCRDVCEHISQ